MKITMAHGSGGRATSELIASVFAKYFKNDILDRMEDSAVLQTGGKVAMTTDSFVVTPLFFKGGNIGKLSVCGTVNDLLMVGARPKYLTCGFIIEEGLELETLEQVALSMADAAREADVLIVAGDTKVVEGKGGLYINTAGIGEITQETSISAKNCRPNDVIILSGALGEHHACILSTRMGIENNIKSDCAPLCAPVFALLDNNIEVKAMRDVTRGGLATVINELSDASRCGAELLEENIPVKTEVSGLCGLLGLDPLYMANEGKFVAVVSEEHAEKAVNLLKSTPYGKDAAIIGRFNDKRRVELKTSIGGRRILDVLTGEGLPRIC